MSMYKTTCYMTGYYSVKLALFLAAIFIAHLLGWS